MEKLADILQEAKQLTIPDPPPSSVKESDVAYARCKVVATDTPSNPPTEIADATPDLG